MKENKLKQVIRSDRLEAYVQILPKDVQAKIKRFDQLHAYCVSAGRPPPDAMRLYRHDWNTINNKIIQASEKAHSAKSVFYKGVPLLCHDEQAKPFELESAA